MALDQFYDPMPSRDLFFVRSSEVPTQFHELPGPNAEIRDVLPCLHQTEHRLGVVLGQAAPTPPANLSVAVAVHLRNAAKT